MDISLRPQQDNSSDSKLRIITLQAKVILKITKKNSLKTRRALRKKKPFFFILVIYQVFKILYIQLVEQRPLNHYVHVRFT